jgi:hypothetical protein
MLIKMNPKKALLCFYMKFKNDFSISVKNVTRILMGSAFNIYFACSNKASFIKLIFPVH